MIEGAPIPVDARETLGTGVVVVYHNTHVDCVSGIIVHGLIPDYGGDSEYARGIAQDGGPIRALNNIFNEVARTKELGFTRTECVFADLEKPSTFSPFLNIALSVKTDECFVADRSYFDKCLEAYWGRGRRTNRFRRKSLVNANFYWERMIPFSQYLLNKNGFADPEVLIPRGEGIVKIEMLKD